MLTIQETIHSSQILETLLWRLQRGDIALIEYRTDKYEGPAGCHLRIRWQGTAGGKQFGIRATNSLGQEGSGYYTPDLKEAWIVGMKEVERFHQPSPLSKKREELRAQLQTNTGLTPEKWQWVAAEEPATLEATPTAPIVPNMKDIQL